jgi:hypothetical protein
MIIKPIPSGKHTKNYGQSPFYSWVNQLFLWPFSIAMLVYQRVTGGESRIINHHRFVSSKHLKRARARHMLSHIETTHHNG